MVNIALNVRYPDRAAWYPCWRPHQWITAPTMEPTSQQHLISSLLSHSTKANGDVMSGFKVELIVWDQELFVTSSFIQRIHLFTFLTRFGFFVLVYSPSLFIKRLPAKNIVLPVFKIFAMSRSSEVTLHFIFVEESTTHLNPRSRTGPRGPRLLDKGCGINWIIFTSWPLIGFLRE